MFVFLFDIAVHAGQPVDLVVDESRLDVHDRRPAPMARRSTASFQVFRSEDGSTWTVLHLDGTVLTIPADAIASEQLDYLKSFALRAARDRKSAELNH